MSVSMTILRQVVHGSETLQYSQTISAGSAKIIDEVIPNGNDNAVNFTADVSQTKLVLIVADGALTLEFNSSSAPDFTITLAANVPVLWATGDQASNPLTQDVTSLFVTNGTGGNVNLKIRYLEDPTP